MEKETPESPIHLDLLRKYILPFEPRLSEREKKGMWEVIERKTTKRSLRQFQPWKWYAAASLLVFAIGSWFLFQNSLQSNPYARMSQLVDVDTLHQVCLYLGEQKVELGGQTEIHCLGASNQVEIRSANNMSFKLAAPVAKETYLQVAVPAGRKVEVILADNSRITVREQSKFGFPLHLSAEKRRVHLEGEAYMKVSRNIYKQFITETPSMDVTVLGTEFLVSAYPESEVQSVLLVSGKVEVKPAQGNKQVLVPNQRYILNTTTKKANLTSLVDPGPYLFWKENLLEVKDEPLSHVLKKIEAIYQTDFSYDWNELVKIRINGKLDVSVPLDELLDRLMKIAPINIDKEQRKISRNDNL